MYFLGFFFYKSLLSSISIPFFLIHKSNAVTAGKGFGNYTGHHRQEEVAKFGYRSKEDKK